MNVAASRIVNIKTKVDDADNKKKPVLFGGASVLVSLGFDTPTVIFYQCTFYMHRLHVLKRDKSTYFQSQLCLLPKLHSSFLNNENRS